jgi:serine/threonine-protein kinase ULK/ATG1
LSLSKLNIVHRDLKLANILIADNFVIKLADFGFARFIQNENALLESYCGTPITMAPEILRFI